MESYAKEMTADGKVITTHIARFLSSEDFHGGGGQEIAVSKEDGPPIIHKQIYSTLQDNAKKATAQASMKVAVEPEHPLVPSILNSTGKRQDSSPFSKRTQTPLNEHLVNTSDSSTLRVKNSFIRPLERLSDGEILMPPTRRITPNVFEINQNEVRHSLFSHTPRDDDRGSFYNDDRPYRRWRRPGRWGHQRRFYSRRRHHPMYVNHRPDVVFVPMYSRNPENPEVQPYESGPPPEMGTGISPVNAPPNTAYGGQVMFQPLSLPVGPPQPAALQIPFQQQQQQQQQLDGRSVMYNVPIATAPAQIPQPIVYPVVTFPAMQQPQQFVQLQPVTQQPDDGSRGLPASHWEDEPGHARSEVGEELPRPPDYDDRRYDDDSYRHDYGNEQRFQSDRDYEEREDYPERGQYYERRPYMEENADSRSDQPELPPPPPPPPDSNEDDDDDDENETDAYQHDLQDSTEPPQGPNDDGPPEIEREDPRPIMNYHNPRLDPPSVVEVPPPPRERMPFRYGYPRRMTMNAYTREQLIGTPLRQRALPRLSELNYQRTRFDSPGSDISEMSADEARFRERMRLELQAKDTIPRGLKSDGLKNVLIRLNGEPLESASELRSRIVHGRIIPGKGKTIRSKGPMKIRVSHRGEGKNRIKIIDIFSPKKFSVVDSRSKIIKSPSMTSSKKSIIHLKSNSLTPSSVIKPAIKTLLKRRGQKKIIANDNKAKTTKKNSIVKIRTVRSIW